MTLDVLRLSGWLNVSASYAESKGAYTIRCGAGGWPADRRERGGCGASRVQRGGSDQNCERRAREERTSNISSMLVTPEVSQLDISALKFPKSLKSPLMSVMAETSQSAMGPYVSVAAVESAL